MIVGMARERLTVAQAAGLAGVTPVTWRSYVSRGQAPPKDGQYDARTPWWWSTTVQRWIDARPGRGWRRKAS